MKLKTLKTSDKFYSQLNEYTNYKNNTMVSTFNKTTINCNQIVQELQFTLLACKSTCKIINV